MGCALAGCSLLTPLDGLEAIDAAAGGDAAADTKIDVEAGVCGSLHGPSMIVVPSLNPSGSYCIDSTEVTQAQYKAFLDANVAPSTQPSFCASNTSFYPDLVQNECASHPFDPTGAPTMPAACVDWCDAYAFCAWAGKRLCGEIGHDAGPLDPQLINAAVHSQWFNACSQEGKLVYPYGNAYDASACNGADQPVRVVVPVATMPGCVGGYPGIFDMSGGGGRPSVQLRGLQPGHPLLRGSLSVRPVATGRRRLTGERVWRRACPQRRRWRRRSDNRWPRSTMGNAT